ncbi:uncharacterized protein [Diabrotica undecimpunctata]|uniref:uncharacterized protein n=1 Tax=Diabrotica undecimpunctata TaxID=50387 RepID=UPI003B63452B
METQLENYLLKCSSMFYGLTPKLTRSLAYEYAGRNEKKKKIPEKWELTKLASECWFTNFMQRHPRLSVRKPEATSLAGMTSFNRKNIGIFQNKLEDVLTRYSFTPAQIYNLDETGVTTIQRVHKVVCKKGEYQIGKVISRIRGELMTHVGIICANGNALPPVWIFSRRRFDAARMMKSVPDDGLLGLAYPSGWMTRENFSQVLKRFVKNVRRYSENRVLLVMDNHESHISLKTVEFCIANGIVILTLPPHTSNKLQPLDRNVFGPFKTFFNQAADSWILSHPGQTLSIYDQPLMYFQSWDRVANPVNIKSGFRSTGIVSFD